MWTNKVNMFKTVLWMSIIVPMMLTLTLFGAKPVKIMPLGDSITRGADFSTVNTIGETNSSVSYRGSLWTELSVAGYNVDFVGSQKTGNDYQATDPSFDLDHEGYSGYRADQINANVTNYLTVNPADIVLLHIGTNDLIEGQGIASTVAEVNSTLDKIDSISQGIKVILARIINRDTYDPQTTNFNNQLNTMAQQRIANGDDITIVDMENGAGIDYAADMVDLLHPNATGYTKMADLWYSVLSTIMTPTLPIALWKLDETTGSIYVDSYGGADGNCTDPGCPLPSTGQVYGSQSFDGVNDRIDITDTAAFDWTPDANVTIEFWMKSNNTPMDGFNDIMIGRNGGGQLLQPGNIFTDYDMWFIGLTFTNGYLKFGLGSSTALQSHFSLGEGTVPITNGEWNHIACIITSNKIKAYVNGQLDIDVDRNSPGQPHVLGTPVNIGTMANWRNTNWSYQGQLDEITVYDTALSAGLIRQHFLNGVRPHLAEVTPVPTPTDNNTPDYTFSTDQAGTITYGGSCSSATTAATVGNNTITFTTLADGTYSDCTITVTDAANNASDPLTVTAFTVNTVVADTTIPVITLLGSDPQEIIVGSAYTELGATAQDDVDGDISTNIVIDASTVDTTTLGQYIVTYDVNDSAGNAAAQVTRTVNVVDNTVPVVDTTAPVITLLGSDPQVIIVGSTYTELGATAQDDVDGDISANIVIDASAVDTTTLGQYTVTYDVNDSAGNAAAQVTRTVNVVDTAVPVITLLGSNPQEIAVGSAYTELGATAQDDVDGDISANIVIDTSAVDTTTLGQYTVTYDVNDSAGNAAVQVTRTINVVDTTATTVNSSGGGCTYNPDSKNFDMSFLLMVALGLFYPFRRRFIKQSSL